MGYEESLTKISRVAAADLTGKEGRFVKHVPGGVDLATGGERPDGVSCEGAAEGGVLPVGILGVARVMIGEAIAEGDLVTPGTDGKAFGVTTGDHEAGKALEDGAADGTFIAVQLYP